MNDDEWAAASIGTIDEIRAGATGPGPGDDDDDDDDGGIGEGGSGGNIDPDDDEGYGEDDDEDEDEEPLQVSPDAASSLQRTNRAMIMPMRRPASFDGCPPHASPDPGNRIIGF